MRKTSLIAATAAVILATPAAAEFELSFYLGAQSLPHSEITGALGERTIEWEGRPFDPPPYYGVRAVYWKESGWGYGVELTHAKAYASDEDLQALGLNSLEFTDGHNIVTANIHRRWEDLWWDGRLTPFLTAGIGIAVPHVDVSPVNGEDTFGYQLTGPAARLGVGISMSITERISAFTEYQITYSDNEADLDSGGSFETELITNALNFGISYSF